MEQEHSKQADAAAQDTKNKGAVKLDPGQAVLAFGSRECDQFYHQDEDRFIIRKPSPLTNFFSSISRQIYSVACGGLHTLLLTTNGEVYTFGCNDDGALGRSGDEMKPAKVELDTPIDMIAAGDSHSIACNSSNSIVYHWGVYRNTSKGNISKVETAHRIGEDEFKRKKIKKILSGANHTLALVEGKIYAWGDAEVGILGRMPTSRRKFDQGLKIEGMGVKGVVEDIYTGAYQAFLKKVEKKKNESYSVILAWGLNNCGQLGIGTTENVHAPVEVEKLRGKNIKNITGGEHHTVVLTEEGEVYCFGKNDDGQLGLGQDYEEQSEEEEEEEENEEEAQEEKKTPAKAPPKPTSKSSKKKGGRKGKKGTAKKGQDKEEENGEDKGEEKADAAKEGEDKPAESQEGEKKGEEQGENKKEDEKKESGKKAQKSRSNIKDKEAGKEEKEKEEGEKRFKFKSVKNPRKVEIANVDKIFSGSNFNYAITKEQDVYSWGMGENYVLGTRNEDTAYMPTKLDPNFFEGKRVVHLGLGAQHVVVLAADKDDKDPELEEEVLKKTEEASKSSKKGTTAKKGEKKGKGKKDEEEEVSDKDVKKDLSKALEEKGKEKMVEEKEEKTPEKEEKKGQKKNLKRKATDENEGEESGKKVKKSHSKQAKELSDQGKSEEKHGEVEAKMDEEKGEKGDKGEKGEEGKIEEEKTENKAVEEKQESTEAATTVAEEKGGEHKQAEAKGEEEMKEGNTEDKGHAAGEEKVEEKKDEGSGGEQPQTEKMDEEKPVEKEEEKKEAQPEEKSGQQPENEGKEENKEAEGGQNTNENKGEEAAQ